ncbi:hypothetical protein BJ508DRAFT_310735 [Ascobolus immersus RN42]|uniref:Uncharacterized protein n=1 Tax=Ascobolus immersus RN42 TaxID=1160509 RepID=A0A3N4HSJ4_ASCIM|nr:hypothetical protein BJ508DRAFT_310735 [Ascobolus immersus RN42]
MGPVPYRNFVFSSPSSQGSSQGSSLGATSSPNSSATGTALIPNISDTAEFPVLGEPRCPPKAFSGNQQVVLQQPSQHHQNESRDAEKQLDGRGSNGMMDLNGNGGQPGPVQHPSYPENASLHVEREPGLLHLRNGSQLMGQQHPIYPENGGQQLDPQPGLHLQNGSQSMMAQQHHHEKAGQQVVLQPGLHLQNGSQLMGQQHPSYPENGSQQVDQQPGLHLQNGSQPLSQQHHPENGSQQVLDPRPSQLHLQNGSQSLMGQQPNGIEAPVFGNGGWPGQSEQQGARVNGFGGLSRNGGQPGYHQQQGHQEDVPVNGMHMNGNGNRHQQQDNRIETRTRAETGRLSGFFADGQHQQHAADGFLHEQSWNQQQDPQLNRQNYSQPDPRMVNGNGVQQEQYGQQYAPQHTQNSGPNQQQDQQYQQYDPRPNTFSPPPQKTRGLASDNRRNRNGNWTRDAQQGYHGGNALNENGSGFPQRQQPAGRGRQQRSRQQNQQRNYRWNNQQDPRPGPFTNQQGHQNLGQQNIPQPPQQVNQQQDPGLQTFTQLPTGMPAPKNYGKGQNGNGYQPSQYVQQSNQQRRPQLGQHQKLQTEPFSQHTSAAMAGNYNGRERWQSFGNEQQPHFNGGDASGFDDRKMEQPWQNSGSYIPPSAGPLQVDAYEDGDFNESELWTPTTSDIATKNGHQIYTPPGSSVHSENRILPPNSVRSHPQSSGPPVYPTGRIVSFPPGFTENDVLQPLGKDPSILLHESVHNTPIDVLIRSTWFDRPHFQDAHGLLFTPSDLKTGDALLERYLAVEREVFHSMRGDTELPFLKAKNDTKRIDLEKQYKRHWLGSTEMMRFGREKIEENEAAKEAYIAAEKVYWSHNRIDDEYQTHAGEIRLKDMELAFEQLRNTERSLRWVENMKAWAESRAVTEAANQCGVKDGQGKPVGANGIAPATTGIPGWDGPRSILDGTREIPPYLRRVEEIISSEIKGDEDAAKMSTFGAYNKHPGKVKGTAAGEMAIHPAIMAHVEAMHLRRNMPVAATYQGGLAAQGGAGHGGGAAGRGAGRGRGGLARGGTNAYGAGRGWRF